MKNDDQILMQYALKRIADQWSKWQWMTGPQSATIASIGLGNPTILHCADWSNKKGRMPYLQDDFTKTRRYFKKEPTEKNIKIFKRDMKNEHVKIAKQSLGIK